MARNRQRARDRKRRAQQGDGDGQATPPQAPPEDLGLPTGKAEEAFGEPADAELEAEALEARGDLDDDGDVDADDAAIAAAPARRPSAAAPSGGPRFVQFIKGSWAELQRVQWPDRRQVAQATAVVLGFVVVAGAYLGLADVVAQELVDFIL